MQIQLFCITMNGGGDTRVYIYMVQECMHLLAGGTRGIHLQLGDRMIERVAWGRMMMAGLCVRRL